MRRLVFLACLALVATGVWLSAPLAQDALAGPGADATAGKAVWAVATCKSCHGNNGEGKYALPLAGTALSAAAVISEVRNNAAAHPIYNTNQISDTALTDLVDYVKTLTKPVTFTPLVYQPKPGDDPGKVLFNQKMCAACHGENGERILAQTLRATGRTTLTQDDIEKQLRTPRRNMPSQSTTLVSSADVAVLAPFLKAAVETFLLTPAPAGSPAAQATAAPTTAAPTATSPAPSPAPAATATTAAVAAVVPTTAPAPANPPAATSADASSNLPLIVIGVVIVLALLGGFFYLRRTPR